ncbi:hypothetical protein [Bifidobacterium tissieri]|uniref:hypothetical protein n=1 Tax=Bifidobacterium tissieri TaxID=1630162 RepID=UPI00168BCA91|nr:hypothetical protein [Bifidobacterium tissieri]
MRLPWRALKALVEHAGPESNLVAECRPELAGWTPQAMLVAQLIDCVNMLRWENACRTIPRNKPKPKQPRPIPRPGVKQDPMERHYGRDPIPLKRFDQWWDSKRRTP